MMVNIQRNEQLLNELNPKNYQIERFKKEDTIDEFYHKEC